MNKPDFVRVVKEIVAADEKFANVSLKDTTVFVEAVFKGLQDCLVNGEKVAIIGFGSFETTERPARIVRNPGTGEEMEVGPTKSVKFKVGSKLKEAVRG